MKIDKGFYWSLKGTLFVLGIIAIFNIVPPLMKSLTYLVELYKLVDVSPEMRMLLIVVSIWVNCTVINTVINIVFKLQNMLKIEYQKENKLVPAKENNIRIRGKK